MAKGTKTSARWTETGPELRFVRTSATVHKRVTKKAMSTIWWTRLGDVLSSQQLGLAGILGTPVTLRVGDFLYL